LANSYYRVTVKQTSRFGSSGRGGSTKNILKNWLRTYVDQRAKQEKEADNELLEPFPTRDREGRLRVPTLPEFYPSAGHIALAPIANDRDPYSRTDFIAEEDSANLWAGGFLAGQYGLARRPEEQSHLSASAANLDDIVQGTNRQKEWIQKLAQHWDELLASPLTARKRSQGIRYAISLDTHANQQLAAAGIPTALALRAIVENTLRHYAAVEGFDHNHETLGWVAGLHQDKEHLHLHVALFPTTSHGTPLRLSDKQSSAQTSDQHLTRLVAIANVETEKFWRKHLPDHSQNPAVQLARLTNQIDPVEGVDLEALLPIYCAHNRKLKHFPPQIATNAFNQLRLDDQNLRDLTERIRLLNNLPENNPEALFATARRHAREEQQIRPRELQRLQELRKLCLRQIWEDQHQAHQTVTPANTIEFSTLFQRRWTSVLQELQELSRRPRTVKPAPNNSLPLSPEQPEPQSPNLQSLLVFGETLHHSRFQTPVTDQVAETLKTSDYWFLWIKERQQELYRLARENHIDQQQRKNSYLERLNQTLLALNQGRTTTATEALAFLKPDYPLLTLQLTEAVDQTSPELQLTVLRQRLIDEIDNAQRSPILATSDSSPAGDSELQAKNNRLTELQGLRLLIQAAQLRKNEETRLRNTFRSRPGSIPTSTPLYLNTESHGCLSWLQQILDLNIKPASSAVLAQEIKNLSPQEILLQNPELLWELRQLALRRKSEESRRQPSPRSQAPTQTHDSGPVTQVPPAASSQILELLKGFNLDL
jgi:hypothetical protein